MKIPFFVQEFTDEMEDAAIHALRNESFVGGESVSIYRKNLTQDCILPENKDGKSVYHQIVIKHKKRDDIRKELTNNEIGSAIYYETPIHMQPIYQEFGYKLPNSEKFSKEIMSLPSYPQLTNEQALEICEHVNKVIG